MGDHEDDMDSLDLSERFRASGEARSMVADDIDFGDEDQVDDEADEDDDEDDDDDLEDDDLEDAGEDEIDLAVAVYREEGEAVAKALPLEVANDLDELITSLRRMPGDSGAIGMVSLNEEVFVLARVRGPRVQVLLSDAASAYDWPIARDVADFLGVEDLPDPDEDEDAVPLGDLGMLVDQGLSQFELSRICDELDEESSDQLVLDIAERIHVGAQVRRVVDASFS